MGDTEEAKPAGSAEDIQVDTPTNEAPLVTDDETKDSASLADPTRLSKDEALEHLDQDATSSHPTDSVNGHVTTEELRPTSREGQEKPVADIPVLATQFASPSTIDTSLAPPSPDSTAVDPKLSAINARPSSSELNSPFSPSEKPSLVQRNTSENLKTKMSNSLSWFSRATTMRRPSGTTSVQSPPGSDTASALGHNRDISNASSPRHSESLQDRFMSLRIQGEGASAIAEAGEDAVDTPLSPANDTPISPTHSRTRSDSSKVLNKDDKLPPGTAVGNSVGPAIEDEGPVNWDLWQAVVQEGPTAVAKTSGDQLNRAIKSGIPQPIRGVVWQVLAQSKNEELETFYSELAYRTTDLAQAKSPSLSRHESNNFPSVPEKESLTSSASSVHSQPSTPATGNLATSPLPATTNIGDTILRASNALVVEKTRSNASNVNLTKLEKTIRRDLGARTSFSKYLASAGMQEPLFRVCKAYALYDEVVSYAQGINFIAMPLLFNMPEEEAFTLLTRLMSNYNMRSMFTAEMTGLHLRLYQFERLLEDFEPALYCHLHRREVTPNLYATQWFLTLFAYRFPLQLVLRIYDLVLSEGLSAILKFGIVLVQKNAQTLLGMNDMSQLTTFLKEKIFDVYIDKSPSANSILESGFFGSASGIDKDIYHADALIRDACAVAVSPETLDRYEAEFTEKTRGERERADELDTLRTTNASLSSRVRALEESAQQLDHEHVGMASELVKTKVENESLRDANETLRTKADELQKMLDAQPAEVEARLKDEMDRIMARNKEVQNANRELEDAHAEMEKVLIATKLEHAQVDADRDALNQKIRSIQSMLGDGKV